MGETIFGFPLNAINTLELPVRFTNIWTNPLGQNVFETPGANGCPDGKLSPGGAFNYIRNKRDLIEKSAQQRPLFRLADKNLGLVGELTGEMSAEFEELIRCAVRQLACRLHRQPDAGRRGSAPDHRQEPEQA